MEVAIDYDIPHDDRGVTIYPEDDEELYDLIEFLQDHGCIIDEENK